MAATTTTITERLYTELALVTFSATHKDIPFPGDENDPLTLEHCGLLIRRVTKHLEDLGRDAAREVSVIVQEVLAELVSGNEKTAPTKSTL